MTPTVRANVGRFSATTVALALTVLVLLIALLTPEPVGKSKGGVSSYSTAPGGAGMIYELAGKFGWRTERRTTTLDSLALRGDSTTTVQVVLAPDEPLGAHEIHALLENVRRGGGLVLSLDGDEDLTDSLGVRSSSRASYFAPVYDATCPPPTFESAGLMTLPPEVREIRWHTKHPPRADTLQASGPPRARVTSAVGFSLGKGRVALIGGSDVFTNQALRVCRWNADVVAMKLIDYTRPAGGGVPVLVFDEFHHGFGTHASAFAAATGYLWRTRSGHFVLQLLAAGLLLLFAMAPRPLVPRDDTRITRRSPLEHAAALGRAYEDVHAARTATATLIGGVRRRTRGIVAVPASAGDDEFLAAALRRLPRLEPQVAIVNQARSRETPARDFAAVGRALAAIEEQLLSTPPTHT